MERRDSTLPSRIKVANDTLPKDHAESRGFLHLGIDVGGTFTDLVVFDSRSLDVKVVKVSTTPDNPELAILQSLDQVLVDANEVRLLNHATTIATNALLTKTGLAKTALVTNKGFRDVLEIGRQKRPEVYNLYTKRPGSTRKKKRQVCRRWQNTLRRFGASATRPKRS